MLKEYRICMPMTIEEYHIGQLYMIARHSNEQSEAGDGVEVVENSSCLSEDGNSGQFTNKRIHLCKRLPTWAQGYIPKWIYATEKAWNYYPHTITEYSCSFIPKLSIKILTNFEDNNGSSSNSLKLDEDQLNNRLVEFIDITEEVTGKYYKPEEDPLLFESKSTNRGPLKPGWMNDTKPIMCSYKVIHFSFPVFGLQSLVEDFIDKSIRFILLLGHRQAFTWIDHWYGMTMEDVRAYERQMHQKTNEKLAAQNELEDAEDAEERRNSAKETPPTTAKTPPTVSLPKERRNSNMSTTSTPSPSPKTTGGYLSSFFKWS